MRTLAERARLESVWCSASGCRPGRGGPCGHSPQHLPPWRTRRLKADPVVRPCLQLARLDQCTSLTSAPLPSHPPPLSPPQRRQAVSPAPGWISVRPLHPPPPSHSPPLSPAASSGRVSSSPGWISVRGARFRVEAGGRSLRRLDRGPPAPPRLDIGGLTFRPASDGTLTADSRQQASRSLIRSVTSGQHLQGCVWVFGYTGGSRGGGGQWGQSQTFTGQNVLPPPFKNRNPVFEACY